MARTMTPKIKVDPMKFNFMQRYEYFSKCFEWNVAFTINNDVNERRDRKKKEELIAERNFTQKMGAEDRKLRRKKV